MKRFPGWMFVYWLVLAVGVTSAAAQINSSSGAVKGVVTDAQGASIPGASVTLINTDTNAQSQTKSQVDGSYVFSLLTPGHYAVVVHATGFKDLRLNGIEVDVAKITNVAAKLAVGTVATEITVSGAAQAIDTTTATTGDVITGRQVVNIPLPTRNFLDLTSLQAGVTATIQSAATVGRGAPTLEVAGARSTSNNYVLDGVDANSFSGNSLSGVVVPNPDAVSEFRVSTSMYDASQGRGAGGNINVVLRSGTDKLHGGAFEFFRNNDLNANDFFLNSAGKPRPELQQNQFGGELGGPVPKLKDTFWFFSYEGTRQVNGVSGTITGSQPVLPARTAGETEAQYASALSTAFGIPTAPGSGPYLDPVAVNLLLLPGQYGGYAFPSGTCAGVTGCTGPGNTGTFALSIPTTYNEDQYVATVDRNLFHNNHLSVQTFWAKINQITPTGGGSTLGQGSTTKSRNENVAITDTETFTNNLLNQAIAGFTYVPSVPQLVENYTVGQIGQAKWDSAAVPGIPTFSATGSLGFGGVGSNADQVSANTSITLSDNMTWTHGRHTLEWGYQWRRYRWNDDDEFDTRGIMSFANFNGFLTGSPSSDQIDVGQFARHYLAYDMAPYIEDDYRVARRVTLNLGLRWDYMGFPIDKQNRLGNFDPSLVPSSCIASGGGDCELAGFVSPAGVPGLGTPGVTDTTLYGNDKNNFAPRLGLSWDVLGNGRLAVRTGYGMYYIRTSGTIVLQLIAAPPWDIEYRGTNLGSDILANPWPTNLPQPSAFPVLPELGQFNGTYTSSGQPVFLNADGSPAASVSLDGFSRNLRTPYAEQYNFNIQYQLTKNWVLETGYIGSQGVKLTAEPRLNQALLVNASTPLTYNNAMITANGNPNGVVVNTNSNNNASLRAAMPGFSPNGLGLIGNFSHSSYNALTIELRRPLARGLQFKADYTYSKCIDENSVDAASAFAFNQLDAGANTGPCDFNVPQRLVFTYVWNIPAPVSGWAGAALKNWEVSGVWTLQSGMPFSILSNTGAGLAGEAAGSSPGMPAPCTGSEIVSGSTASNVGDWLNKSCFAAVPTQAAGATVSGLNNQSGPGTGSFPIGAIAGDTADNGSGTLIGTLGRNLLQGPSEQRFDLAAVRNVPVHRWFGEQGNLQIRAEAFKLFNNVNFSNPANNVSVSTFGRITSTIDNTGRIVQLGLKLNF